eukprot:4558305-Pyramimonas_sp.AAC.1
MTFIKPSSGRFQEGLAQKPVRKPSWGRFWEGLFGWRGPGFLDTRCGTLYENCRKGPRNPQTLPRKVVGRFKA